MLLTKPVAASAAIFALATTIGCSAEHQALRPKAPGAVVTSTKADFCGARQAALRFRALIRDFNSGSKDVVKEYFATPTKFEFWWDPTLESGSVLQHEQLPHHLRALHSKGIRLQVTRDPQGGRGFTFGVLRSGNKSRKVAINGGKGLLDCATGKYVRLVIDRWSE